MTLPSELTKVQYNGDDVTTAFAVSFVFYDDDGLRVILLDTLGAENVQVLDTDYTLAGGGGATGTLTMITPPATGETLTIKSDIDDTQDTALPLGGKFPSTAVELRFDILTRLVQQKQEDIARSIKLNETSENSDVTIADAVTGEILFWKADGSIASGTLLEVGSAAISVDETDTDVVKNKMVSNNLAFLWEDVRTDWDTFDTLLTTKGDLLAFSTLRTRLGIGTNGQRLVPNSAVALGVEWDNLITTDNKAAAYTVIASDQGKLIGLSSTSFTVSLTSAATLGNGFTVGFHHNGTTGANLYTIDPDGSENIDDDATIVLDTASESVWIVSDGTNWHIFSRNTPKLRHSVQTVNVQDGAVATGTTVIPYDDTIPQITEGDEYMTLAITPLNVNNILKIDVVFNGASTSGTQFMVALFQDTTADALAVATSIINPGSSMENFMFSYYVVAGTLSSTTFRVRAAATGAGTTTFNGAIGARKFGGVSSSSITITEYVA